MINSLEGRYLFLQVNIFWLISTFPGPLTDLPAFSHVMIKWCSMHVINLGISLWVCGSAMRSIAEDFDFWGDRSTVSMDNLLSLAYDRFRSWTRERKIQFPGIMFLFVM